MNMEKTKNTKNGLCIYHANCNDGFAAALAVWKKYGDDWDYVPMQYGDKLCSPLDGIRGGWVKNPSKDPNVNKEWYTPHDPYENIMLVDFSLTRPYMEELSKLTNLLVIDHHKTAKEACEGLDFCIFDLEKSGCELTWEYLFPDEEIPELLKWIGDRDLWKFKLHYTKEVCAALQLYSRSFTQWDEFIRDTDAIEDLVREGTIIVNLQDLQTKRFVDQWHENRRFVRIGSSKYRVPIANCCELISEKIGALSKGYPFACGYFETHEKRVFSLRSRGVVDCGLIAKEYGGGGHPNAAGFSIPLSKLDPEMSDEFWQSFFK